MKKNKLDSFKGMLLRQLQRVCCAIEAKREQSREELNAVEADPFDLCVQSFSREQLYLLCERERQTLALVREALARIQSNSYGFCEECEAPIAEKRLRALPWSKLCNRCQSAKENALVS